MTDSSLGRGSESAHGNGGHQAESGACPPGEKLHDAGAAGAALGRVGMANENELAGRVEWSRSPICRCGEGGEVRVHAAAAAVSTRTQTEATSKLATKEKKKEFDCDRMFGTKRLSSPGSRFFATNLCVQGQHLTVTRTQHLKISGEKH